MGSHRSYVWCHQEPTRSAGTRQGIHDAMSQRMCCGKWSAIWTSRVILKRVPSHERKSISRNLFIFGPMLIGTFLLKWGWEIPRKSLWHRFWDTLYIYISYDCPKVNCVLDTCFSSIFVFVVVSWIIMALQNEPTKWHFFTKTFSELFCHSGSHFLY
jgi:hypothetical protein